LPGAQKAVIAGQSAPVEIETRTRKSLMGMKSRLFASAAFPLLSLAFAVPPIGAYAAVSGGMPGAVQPAVEGSYQVAQDAPSEEELLKKKKKLEEGQQRQKEAPAEKPRQSEAPAEAAPEPEQKP
jgi:hypothetical protein